MERDCHAQPAQQAARRGYGGCLWEPLAQVKFPHQQRKSVHPLRCNGGRVHCAWSFLSFSFWQPSCICITCVRLVRVTPRMHILLQCTIRYPLRKLDAQKKIKGGRKLESTSLAAVCSEIRCAKQAHVFSKIISNLCSTAGATGQFLEEVRGCILKYLQLLANPLTYSDFTSLP